MLPIPLPSTQLRRLVQQLLLGRLEELDARGAAAFVHGFTSALQLVRRSDLTNPNASAEVHAALATAVDMIDCARRALLEDEPD